MALLSTLRVKVTHGGNVLLGSNEGVGRHDRLGKEDRRLRSLGLPVAAKRKICFHKLQKPEIRNLGKKQEEKNRRRGRRTPTI